MMGDFATDFMKQFYGYKRPFQEVRGYAVKHLDSGNDVIVINALGINPQDIQIEVKPDSYDTQVISVSGETENNILREIFSVKLSWYVKKPIKTIYKEFTNGLIVLEIEYDVPQQPKVAIVERKALLKD